MSSPLPSRKSLSFRRPDSQRKKVSSCWISEGPSLASAAALGSSASTLAIRALISTLRAIAGSLLGRVANRFDVVAVRGDDEGGVVVRVVVRTQAGRTVVLATCL